MPSTETEKWIGPADKKFHTHLDECPQCSDDPCNLCRRGDLLLHRAAAEIAEICRVKIEERGTDA